jgi:hypothetical protein
MNYPGRFPLTNQLLLLLFIKFIKRILHIERLDQMTLEFVAVSKKAVKSLWIA